jgi:hypothetical protein
MSGISLAFLGYALYNAWSEWKKVTKLQRDITNHAIRQVQGKLLYDEKGYSFELNNGLQLHLPANKSNGLLPGVMYELFYLEESGFCLSAAEAGPISISPQQQSTLNEMLRTANDFSNEDLVANQKGKVTFAQLVKKPFANLLLQLAIFGLLLIPGTVIFISLEFNVSPILIIGAIFLIGLVILRNTLIDIIFPNLQQVQGRAYKTIENVRDLRGRHEYYRYFYAIDNQWFEVNNKTAYTALIDGLEYRIYYLPRTKRLMSIENISSVAGTSSVVENVS